MCVQESQEKLDAGIKAVEELISQDLAPLVYDRSRKFEGGDRDNGYNGRVRRPLLSYHLKTEWLISEIVGLQRKWDEEKLYLEFEPLRNFNVRAKTVGPGVSSSWSLLTKQECADLMDVWPYRVYSWNGFNKKHKLEYRSKESDRDTSRLRLEWRVKKLCISQSRTLSLSLFLILSLELERNRLTRLPFDFQ